MRKIKSAAARLLCALLLLCGLSTASGADEAYYAFVPDQSVYFYDVTGDYSWAHQAVDFLASGGVLTGQGSHLLGPEDELQRGDFILMLYRAYSMAQYIGADNFSDVTAGDYYALALSAARTLGIATGTDNLFYPTRTITRQDAMVFLKRTLDKTGVTLPTASLSDFSDSSAVSDYAREAVSALVGAGVITGIDGKLQPTASVTRAQMAVMLYRALHLTEQDGVSYFVNDPALVNLCIGDAIYSDVRIENYRSGVSYQGLRVCQSFRKTDEGYTVRLGDAPTTPSQAVYENGVLTIDGVKASLSSSCVAVDVTRYCTLEGLLSTGDSYRHCYPSVQDGVVTAVYYVQ